MSEFSIELPTLVTATLSLSLTATLAWLTLNWIKPQGHRLHRLVWMAVLLQGIMLIKISVDLPVLDAESPSGLVRLLGDFPEQNSNDHHSITPAFIAENSNPKPIETDEALTTATQVNESVDSESIAIGTPPRWEIGKLLTWFWLCGIFVSIAYVLYRYFRVLLTTRSSEIAPRIWSNQCDTICRESGLQSSITMLTHAQMGPALVLTPVGYRIIVPEILWDKMSQSQRAAVLRHEVEHFRRGDVPISFLAWLVASVHWFNPFAWLAVQQLNASAEWACDDAATAKNGHPSEFARALLSISTANSRHLVGANGFGSSDLKTRIDRLLNRTRHTSRMGNMALSTLVLVILLSGWINLRLITETVIADISVASRIDDGQMEKNIDEWSSKLSDQGDTNKQLKRLAKTPAGKIAIANSVADIENELRNEATKDIVPEFFEKEVQENFHKNIAKESSDAKLYIQNLSEALADIKSEFAGTTDADKLFLRFLNAKDAATVLYFGELRKQLNPDQKLIMRNLGRFLAQDDSGKFIVRESAKAPLAEKLTAFEGAEEHVSFLQEELTLLGNELMASDELHEKCRKRLLAGRGAPIVIASAFKNPGQLDNHITKYLEDLDGFFVDAPDGLMIASYAREHLSNGMQEMDRLVNKMERLKKPILRVVDNIDTTAGDIENQVKKFLGSDVGLAVLSMQIEIEDTSLDAIINRIRSEILQTTDDGLIVRSDRHEEISEFSRRMLKGSRNLRRQLRMVDSRAGKLPQDKIGRLLESAESKLILLEKIKQYAQELKFEGWPIWVETHFEFVDGKYSIKAQSQEIVQYLVQEVEAIEKELSNDDF